MAILQIFILIFLQGATAVVASEAPLRPGFPLSFSQLEKAILDNPNSWPSNLKEDWKQLNADNQPQVWIQYAWFINTADVISPEDLAKAIAISKKIQNWRLWAVFSTQSILSNQPSENSYEALNIAYGALVQEARTLTDPLPLAYILASWSVLHMDHNVLAEGSRLVKESHELMLQSPDPPAFIFQQVENSFGLALTYQNQYEAAVDVYERMIETFKKQGFRSTLATTYYNLGFTYIKNSPKPEHLNPKAVENLQESLRLSTEIQDSNLIAQSQYGLSVAYSMLNEHEQAVRFAQQALDRFEKTGSKEWIAPGYFRMAKALLAAGRFPESLVSIDKAEKAFDKVDRKSLNDLVMLRVKAYKGMHRFEEALEQLFIFLNNQIDIYKSQEEKNYSKASAEIGLQFQKERNSILATQNEMQEQKINLLKKFRILSMIVAGLLLCLLIVFFRMNRQSKEIQTSRQKMKEILDTIDEGIMIIDQNLQVTPGYSPHLDKIFHSNDQSLVGRSIIDLLFAADQDSSTRIMTQDTLHTCLGEKRLTWDLNADHLPIEMERDGCMLQFHWQALLKKQEINAFLLSIRDITEWKEKEKAIKADVDRAHRLQEKLEEILAHDWTAARNFIFELQKNQLALQNNLFSEHKIGEVFLKLHGWKGNARTLNLKQLAAAIHNLENYLDIRNQAFKNKDAAEREWNLCCAHIEDYARLLGRIPGDKSPQVQNLYSFVPQYVREFQQRLETAQLSFEGIAIEDSVRGWLPDRLALVHEILIHALTNAMDHGYILASKRGKSVRPAHIRISAHHQNEQILIRVEDNGAGIDWKALRLKKAGDESLQGIEAFTGGVSTTTQVTETSGRGVGMSAIRSISQELGGKVTIEDVESGGTRLLLQFPAESLSHSSAA